MSLYLLFSVLLSPGFKRHCLTQVMDTGAKKYWMTTAVKIEIRKLHLWILTCFHASPLRYVRILGNVVHAIQIKTKLCQLVEVMMERRDDLSFCQEMKFRSVAVCQLHTHVS